MDGATKQQHWKLKDLQKKLVSTLTTDYHSQLALFQLFEKETYQTIANQTNENAR